MLEIVGFALTALGTAAGLFSVLYAYRAANRSDKLLRRLVVYPFRELDVEYARLNQNERNALMHLFLNPKGDPGGYERQMLQYLMNERWIVPEGPDRYSINVDRVPYLTFVNETVRGGIAGGIEK